MNRLLSYILSFYLFVLSIQSQAAIRPYQPEDFLATIHSFNSIAGIKVLKTDLKLDFQQSNIDIVVVNAVYEIKCTSRLQNFRFILGPVSGYNNSVCDFDLNGQPLKQDSTKTDSISPAWFPKDTLQWNDQKNPYYYFGRTDVESYFTYGHEYASYTIDELPEGRHTIKISYSALMSKTWHRSDNLSVYKSFVYVLQPDVDSCKWESFNNLNITVVIPKKYEYFTNIDFSKNETESKTLKLSASYNNTPSNYISFTLHKNNTKALIISAIFAIVSSLIIIGICVFVLVKWAKKRSKLKNHIAQTRTSTVTGVLTVNYLATCIVLLIEYIIIMVITQYDNQWLWLVVLGVSAISIPVSICYFPSKHISRKVLRCLNCIAYGFAVLIAVYHIIKYDGGSTAVLLLLSVLMILLYLVGRFSVSKRRQGKLVNGSGTFGVLCLLAALTTVAFYIILFNYDDIMRNMMDGFLVMNFATNGMIIIAAPLIFVVSLLPLAIVYNIIKHTIPQHSK